MTRHVLGPCPCRECGRLLVWDGLFWLFLGTHLIHNDQTCPATWESRPRARRVRT